jgi:hypothetical protein
MRLESHDEQRREWARKVRPEYTQGELVRVAGGRNLAEAELIQGLLLESGVPSMIRRTRGFDVPDFLAAGPRDVLVPAAAERVAHEILLDADLAPQGQSELVIRPARIVAGVVAAVAVVALLAWLGTAL